MSTATNSTISSPSAAGAHLTFMHLVRSEWIKLRSIRSTAWCYAIIIVLTVAMSALPALTISPAGGSTTEAVAEATTVLVATINVSIVALVVGVLGVLIVSSEYSTGMIRATFTAAPGRIGVLLAKAFVLALTTFIVSAVATWVGVLIASSILHSHGVEFTLGHSAVFLPILGSSLYVTLIALLAFSIGLIVRSSAGGIAITLGILLVLPIVLSVVASVTNAVWISDVMQFLPSEAGSQLYSYRSDTSLASPVISLNGWEGFLVLLAEVAAIGALALTAARTRDA